MAIKGGGTNFAGDSVDGVRVHFRDQANDVIYATGDTVPTNGTSGYAKGCLFIDTDVTAGTSWLYENKGSNTSCTFALISTSGVTGSLDNAYSIGSEVSVDEGAVVWNDATAGALNTMEFVKSGAGTGNVLDITYSAAATGDALSIAMGTAVAASALALNGTGARTDDLIKIDDDSTSGASCIDINLSGAFTTAYAIDLTASGTHTSGLMNLTSDSANIGARNLVNIHNDNTAAVGTVPLNITQDAVTSTNFKLVMTMAWFTIYISDGTTAEGALTGVAGDLCLNWGTGTGQLAFCDAAGTNWTDM